jgi:polyphosphate kinase 2
MVEKTPVHDPHKVAKLSTRTYEAEMYRLQSELAKLQVWTKETGQRIVIIFEGRDAAGKGGTIKRITEYLSPRIARVAALPAPTEREKTQWYFQRYIAHLPAAGEIVLFDRSWYNRAGVEKVMGFATPREVMRFMRQCPLFEQMLVEDGILLRKYWFSVSDKVQYERFQKRINDPLRQWKLSPMDLESITNWEEYSRAKDEMLVHTDTPIAPWYQVGSDSKKSARINMIHHLLTSIPYQEIPTGTIELPPRPDGYDYRRPSLTVNTYVPDHAATLEPVRGGTPPHDTED